METHKIMSVLKFLLSATSNIGSILWLLVLLGFIPEPLFRGVDFLANYFILFVVLALLIFFLSALWLGYQIHARRNRAGAKGENVTISPPIQKGTNSLSKFFRRPPIEKEKRPMVWITMITMLIMGVTVIAIAFSLSVTPALPNMGNQILVGKISLILFGIGLLSFFAWFTTNELYNMWKSQQLLITKRNTTYTNRINAFKEASDAVQEASNTDIKAIMLDNFQDKLRTLCDNYKWNEVKDEIEKTLECVIPEKLFHESHAEKYIQFLAMIINHFSEQVTTAINQKWLKEIGKFYDDPNYDTTSISNVFNILLQLHEYSKNYLMKLIDDASTLWSNPKWQTLGSDFRDAFYQLKKRDDSEHKDIVSYLRLKMEEAKKLNKEDSFGRLYTLYKMANGEVVGMSSF